MNFVRIAIAALVAVLLSASCSPAPANPAETLVDTFDLDLAGDGGDVSATGPVLEDGGSYVLVVQGTFSIWGDGHWSGGTCNGTAEDAPLFPSPSSSNGPVGLDAEFFFGIPFGSSLCDDALPDHSSRFEISTDGGASFAHVEPEGGQPTAPRSDHTYRYAVEGEGQPVQVRREDSATADDYGILRIEVHRVD